MTIEPLDFFVLRTPRLAAKTIDELNANRAPEELATYFYTHFQAQELRDAIAVASEPLHAELLKFLADGPSSLSPKLAVTLYKYVVRMAMRSTPFGLFAGIALGQISTDSSRFVLSGSVTPTFRIDMAFAAHLTRWAHAHTDIRKHITYRKNSSLITFDDHYRYMGYHLDNGNRHYRWMRTKRNPLLDLLMTYTCQTRTYRDVCTCLAQVGLNSIQVEKYVDQLVANQCLIPGTEPVATGKKPVTDQVAAAVGIITESHGCFAPSLKDARKVLATIPPAIRNGYKGSIIQADLAVGTHCNQLARHTAQLLTREIGELIPLARHQTPADLADFCRRFTLRYDTREVRLLEALDPDRGVGYGDTRKAYRSGSSLLQHLGLHENHTDHPQGAEHLHQMIMRRHTVDPLKTPIIELSAEDIQSLASSAPFRPADTATTGYLMGQLVAPHAAAIDKGDFLFHLHIAAVRSALPLMARFCHLDKRLENKLRQCVRLEDEASPDVCLAEIVFIPDDRMGNVMLRPALRDYELILTGHGGVADDSTIPVADLLISVVKGHVVLRSDKLDKIIVPRLSCAHNYRTGTSLYRFLCDLQQQSHSLSIGWDWGAYNAGDFLPRVTYKHVVLTRARWRITMADDQDFFRQQPLVAAAALRSRYQLPTAVILAQGDNELLLDLTHVTAATVLINHLKHAPAILFEHIARQGDSPVEGLHGNTYHNEIILPFKTNGQFTVQTKRQTHAPIIRRSFPPGSEWVYLKLYMGLGECDRLLITAVSGFINQLKQEGLLQKWFFVRYADPEYHLRIRVLLWKQDGRLPLQSVATCASRYFEPAMEQGLIYRMQYDTYERELERYGGAATITCETVFQLDSEASLALLPHFITDPGEKSRLVCAMIAVDDLLDAFGLQAATKLQWVTGWWDSFFQEFGGSKDLKLKLDQKFRENRAFIEQHFGADLRHTGYRTPLGYRLGALKTLNGQRWITPPIAASLSHMFVNRHFHTEQREMELVVYHFLIKCYRTNRYQNDGALRP